MTYEDSAAVRENRPWNFEPDVLLDDQFYDQCRRALPLEPEKSLMLAVLHSGVNCYQKYAFAAKPRGKRLFREAEEWIFEEDGNWIFSFDVICAVLGLDAPYIRSGLMKWKQGRGPSAPKVISLALKKTNGTPSAKPARKGFDEFPRRRAAV